MMQLINALLKSSAYDHATDKIELLQTHISWIILTGDFAYKIKKPVNFGFLDFSSLEKRRHYCEEELRLNQRLAPQLYLDVITITGSADHPLLNGEGEILEYAVKMKQFPSNALLSTMLDNGDLREIHMDWLAQVIADFHQQAGIAAGDSEFGTADAIARPVRENFLQIRQQINDPDMYSQLDALEKWSTTALTMLLPEFDRRKQGGYIRECHGDLHLGNIILLHKKIIPFDCLEFNENLRWIDVLSEIAFLLMDLEDHQRPDLARRLLNKYLEYSGDYRSLKILQFYKVYRAMVRAKVHALLLPQGYADRIETNADQETESAVIANTQQCRNYLRLGSSYITEQKPVLIIMHGFSGSGKTTISQFIIEALPIIRIRSDIERKRLYKQPVEQKTPSEINAGIYDEAASSRTYSHLRGLAEDIILAGKAVIVDAAFLQAEQRKIFARLADRLKIPFRIIDCHAEHEILLQRISERQVYGDDASDATGGVLFYQQENHDPLSDEERAVSFSAGSTEAMAIKTITDHLGALIHGHADPDSYSDDEILRHP